MNAHDRCRTLQETLAAKYPTAGLTFGYIGNVERGRDDRTWMFWATNFRTGLFGNAASFGYHESADLDALADSAETDLETWIVNMIEGKR